MSNLTVKAKTHRLASLVLDLAHKRHLGSLHHPSQTETDAERQGRTKPPTHATSQFRGRGAAKCRARPSIPKPLCRPESRPF
ncbi:MAG: DUF2397 family protein [Mesorhizobium sp.]|nr:MAG: DUF2397 family protein [Mesorhizobium sp.]